MGRPGQSIPKEIEKALPKSRKVGLIMSPDAMHSAWVELERLVTTYIAVSARDERLIPLYRRTCDIPALLRPILYIDFRDEANFEKSNQTLLAVIKDEPLSRRSGTSFGNSTALPPLIPRPPVVGFVARRDDKGRDIIERLKEELAPQRNQLVALWGAGGVGKTTLAAEAVRALTLDHKHRVVWTSAERRADFTFSTFLDEIASRLNHDDVLRLAIESKAAKLQAIVASVPTLIVLDNFETILPEESKRCVEFLIQQSRCPTLITTREVIDGALNIPIDAMSVAEAQEFLERFIKQSSGAHASTGLDRERIVQTAAGNPLVMQWVVAQIGLAQRTDDVLDDLAHGEGDAAQRVFDRSFNLPRLGDDGRAALLALSLFVPSASRPALAEVSGFGANMKRLNDAVKRLAALRLVSTTAGAERLMIQGLTRELAKARLMKDKHSYELSKRFVVHFVSDAEAHAQPTSEDFDALESEKDNVLDAMEMASAMKDWDSVMKIRWALEEFLDLRGYWNEAIRSGRKAVSAGREARNELAIEVFRTNTAVIHMHRGEYKEAKETFQQSLAIIKK